MADEAFRIECCMGLDLDLSGTQMMLQAKNLSINLYLSRMLLHSSDNKWGLLAFKRSFRFEIQDLNDVDP